MYVASSSRLRAGQVCAPAKSRNKIEFLELSTPSSRARSGGGPGLSRRRIPITQSRPLRVAGFTINFAADALRGRFPKPSKTHAHALFRGDSQQGDAFLARIDFEFETPQETQSQQRLSVAGD
ncbi:hypothetical protein Pla52o_26570 [Novipirellula galeiformis]|uniref:Uncharacterized protein n=1 Tax=Novipirellula galeiformis TaxID=2528004 RepID=A0A5C6CG21_9BACT|nr:hypothetical protein Pla52o_26570 [Novipirellula galeiformis]